MSPPIAVLIAACSQPELLRRTLQTLSECQKPLGYAGVVVAENGPKCGPGAVVAAFPADCHFRYFYSEPANKSLALNRALATIDDKSLVVFTDDDVQVPRGTLLAYARAAAGRIAGEFYGGQIIADYEGDPPPPWLMPL